jgi:hypothetical protein
MTTETSTISTGHQPQLLDQTIVVIGGSTGIGLETARRCPRQRHAISERPVLAPEVAHNAAGRMTAGGTLLLIGGTGGRRISRNHGIAAAGTVVVPPFTAALALDELAPVRVNLCRPRLRGHPVVGITGRRPTRGQAGELRANSRLGESSDRRMWQRSPFTS